MTKDDPLKKAASIYSDKKIPKHLKVVNKHRLKIQANDILKGLDWQDVTVKDVVRYYYQDARDILSSCRTLGAFTGDWRYIDDLAQECLRIFKAINPRGLERESRRYKKRLKEASK